MGEDTENERQPVEIKASNKSANDLEAEIAATAAALGGEQRKIKPTGNEEPAVDNRQQEKPVQQKEDSSQKESQSAEPATKQESKQSETTKESEPKPKATEKNEQPQAEEDNDAGETVKVSVKPSSTKKATTTPPSALNKPRHMAQSSDAEANDDDEQKLASHKAKTIAPLSDQASPQQESNVPQPDVSPPKAASSNADETATTTPGTPAQGPQNGPPQTAPAHTPPVPEPDKAADTQQTSSGGEDQPVNSETARKLDAMSGELKARQDAKEQQKKEQQQVKVYDTKKYHLPIKPGRHHSRNNLPVWAQALIIAAAIGGATAYLYYSGAIQFTGFQNINLF